MDLSRDVWSVLNKIRTGHGRSDSMMYKWSLKDSSACDYGYDNQTIQLIVDDCPKGGSTRALKEFMRQIMKY
jgi:hypothetical protein